MREDQLLPLSLKVTNLTPLNLACLNYTTKFKRIEKGGRLFPVKMAENNNVKGTQPPTLPLGLVSSKEEDQPTVVTQAMVLDNSCERSVDQVKELVLRRQGVTGLEEECAKGMTHLEVLSLSHNKLVSLEHFENLSNLTELNLNFNGIVSISQLSCPQLRRLYLSSNRLCSLEDVARFPALQTLCAFRNRIESLDDAVRALKPLKRLRELDLDGNPCSFDRRYRHYLVDQLPRVETLDGEPLAPLDKEVSLRKRY
tara:strand:- start:1968 stop:2732 length:765 start_codon:yes stop_codon:yes gene_type:complete